MREINISKKLFGGKIDFVIYNAPEKIVKKIVEEVYTEGLHLQKIFNMYDSKSELSLLNKSRREIISNQLLKVLQKALLFSKMTKGSYDVTLGKCILLRKQGKIVEPKCSYKDVSIKGNEVVLTHSEVMIDLGSIAKGYIADRLAELLQKNKVEEFLIDARGDICVRGKHAHLLGIQHPRNKKSIICSIKLKNQAVATSGDYKQYVKDFKISHIINQKNAISITVVAKTVEEADIYATALLSCSTKKRNKLIKSNKNIKVLIMENEGNLKMLNNFEELIQKE